MIYICSLLITCICWIHFAWLNYMLSMSAFFTIGRKLVVITCRVNLVVLCFKCTNHWIFVWREPPKEGVTRPNAAQPAVQSKTLLLDHQATSQGPDRSVGTGHGHSHSIAAATASTTTGNENCFAHHKIDTCCMFWVHP